MRRLSYANVVASLALFLALGGGVVYAANKISSKDIKRDAVRSKHIKDGQVKGKDVKEASLDVVPEANAVGGIVVKAISQTKEVGDGLTTLVDLNGSTFSWSCGATGVGYQISRGSGAPPMLVEQGVTLNNFQVFKPSPGNSVLANGFANWSFTITIRAASGEVKVLDVNAFKEEDTFGGPDDCFLQGELRSIG